MGWGDLFDFKRNDIVALHKTWFAFFLTFFVWFNMAPLATTIIKSSGLTVEQIKLLAICNVALTAPSRVIIGILTDRLGPRRTFTIIMVAMAMPCFAFALADTYTQMLVSRLLLSMVGTGFVVGIHMTSLWFKPRDIGFAQGVEAGLGNWGSSIAALVLPFIALNMFSSWRWAIALSGLMMLIYGIFYWFAITDGPSRAPRHRAKKLSAIEVSSWVDVVNAIIWTVPIIGVLALLVWRITELGFLGENGAYIALAAIAIAVVYQIAQILRVNIPILKKGVPEDDKYRFTDVACLNMCYVSCFGAELAVVSMIPMFFQKTYGLTPQMAGIVGAIFPFTNFFARPMGGFISDRSPSRRASMLICLAGIAAGFIVMGMMTPAWPLWLACVIVFITALFVMAAEGTTFALVPLVKRRLTGQISGYVGAYGNVGAIAYLTAHTFVSDSRFFWILGLTSGVTLLFCYFMLKEPAGAFAEEYQISSVDREIMEG